MSQDDEFRFWYDSPPASLTEAEAAESNSPEATGARVVAFIHGICRRAWSDLPPEARQWIGSANFDLPDWMDTRHPHLAVDAIHHIAQRLPKHYPAWIDFTPGQERAMRVLLAVRAMASSISLVADPGAAVLLIEAVVEVTNSADRAHVTPWQGHVAAKVKQDKTLVEHNRGTPAGSVNHAKHTDAEEKRARYQQAAKCVWSKNPTLSKSRVAEILASDEELRNDGLQDSPNTIRRKIEKQ